MSGVLFLSHASEDVAPARELARHLRDTGLRVWLDVDDLRPGDPWMESIELALAQADAFAVLVGGLGVQRWVDRELRLALARNVDHPGFRIIPLLGEGAVADRLPAFLKQYQSVTVRGDTGFRDVAARLRELLDPAVVPLRRLPEQAPFRGLERFDAADSIFFFGRDRAVEGLLQRMRESNVVAVVGASGVGKSSLVRAGLLPALFRGRHSSSADVGSAWRAAVFRPGDNVLRELASALPQLKPDASDAERLELRAACLKHLEATADLYGVLSVLTPPGAHCVLVVDQFEELTTLNPAAQRQQFVEIIWAALAARGDRKLYLILTLRADFLADCWQVPGLIRLLDQRTYLVPPMDPSELEDVITGPLELIGGGVEPGLIQRIVADLGTDPGRLPLLQHALLQLWKGSSNRILSHQTYEGIGGVSGALRNHAEEVYLDLSEADRKLARATFLRMVRAVPQARPTRRRVTRDEIERLTGESEGVARVLAQLIEARLVVGGVNASAGPHPDDQVVEIVHETLLENWQRYVHWIEQEIDSLRVEDELRVAADQWHSSGKDLAYLFTGSRLHAAKAWAEEHRSIVTDRLREFLEQSASEFETISRLRSGEPLSTGLGWRIQADAGEWFAAGSDAEFLYRPAKLKRARAWADANPGQVGQLTRDFLEASEEYNQTEPSREPESTPPIELLMRDLQAAFQLQVAAAGTLPTVAGFSFGRYWKPARVLSGDVAGCRTREDGTIVFWLADTAGKGVPAALYANTLQALLLASDGIPGSPADVMRRANRILCEQSSGNRFATCVYGILDPPSRLVRLANAGSVSPVLASRTAATRIQVGGMPLGILPGADYEFEEFSLGPGSRLAVFSDGVSEAVSPGEEEFGEERVINLLASSWDLSASHLADRFGAELESFAGDHGLFDDASLLIIQAG